MVLWVQASLLLLFTVIILRTQCADYNLPYKAHTVLCSLVWMRQQLSLEKQHKASKMVHGNNVTLKMSGSSVPCFLSCIPIKDPEKRIILTLRCQFLKMDSKLRWLKYLEEWIWFDLRLWWETSLVWFLSVHACVSFWWALHHRKNREEF